MPTVFAQGDPCEALTNGDFEKDKDDWDVPSWAKIKTGKGVGGSKALYIKKNKSIDRIISVQPDQEYSLSFSAKFDDDLEPAASRLEFLDASQVVLVVVEEIELDEENWKTYNYTDFKIPPGVAFIRFVLKTGKDAEVLLDDVCLTWTNVVDDGTPSFLDSAAHYGINAAGRKHGGLSFADFDNDGFLDLVLNTNDGGVKSRLYRNLGNNTFKDITGDKAPALLSNTMERAAVWADLNNDGYLDFMRNTSQIWSIGLAIEIYFQHPGTQVFGDGLGGINPITVGENGEGWDVEVYDGINTEGLGAVDFDGDGDLDIIFDNHNHGIDVLRNNYVNHADNSLSGLSNNKLFEHATRRNGASVVLGLDQTATDGDYGAFCDLDDNGWVDIFMRKRDENDVFINNGGTFANGQDLAQADNNNKGSNAIYDFDNDGDYDVFWTENGDNQLFRNDGGVWTPTAALNITGIPTSFSTEINEAAGGDIDNDGDIDLVLVGKDRSFLYINLINDPIKGANAGTPLTFKLEASESFSDGGEAYGTLMVDIDNDGDLDIYFNRSGGNRLFINDLYDGTTPEYKKNALRVQVWDDRTEYMQAGQRRPALGATVVLKDCFGNVLSGTREVSGGNGRGTQNPSDIHFGLPYGRNFNYVVEVRYPNYRKADGTVERILISKHFNPSDFEDSAPKMVFTTNDTDTDCPAILEICDNGIDDDGDGNIDCPSIYGTIFEDINYGGGPGRNYATANASAMTSGWGNEAIGLDNVTLELYDASGNFLQSTTTSPDGTYALFNVNSTDHYLRVVSNTVVSNRVKSGSQTILPVMTFYNNGSEVTTEIGGQTPSLEDVGINTGELSLSTLTSSSSGPTIVIEIPVGNADMLDLDIGLNFSTIVNTNNAGQGSFRQFLINASSLSKANLDQEDNPSGRNAIPKMAGSETSIFEIPGSGVHTIQTTAAFPSIQTSNLHLTGYTQVGSAMGYFNTRTLTIEFFGNTTSYDAFYLDASNISLSGMSITGYRRGVFANRSSISNLHVWGNTVGLRANGSTARNNSSTGIFFQNQSSGFIGTNGDGSNDNFEGNVASENYEGITLRNCENILIAGNRIGTSQDGNSDRGNRYHGIFIRDCPQENIIGFDDDLSALTSVNARNLSSGNGTDGIRITSSSNQRVSGNVLGANATGTSSLSNDGYGVQFTGSVSNNIIGTNSNGSRDVAERNIISGNGTGLRFLSSSTGTGNLIQGNYIGTDFTGNSSLGNLNNGFDFSGAQTNLRVGTNGDGVRDVIERNVIAGNAEDGIRLAGTNGVIISGNYIGVGADGTTPLGNGKRGIFIDGTSNQSTIGYDPSMTNDNPNEVGNLIRYNLGTGIGLSSSGTGMRMSRNLYGSNGGLAIDLDYDGVTRNDDGDSDSGPNNLMNYPIITYARTRTSSLVIRGYSRPGAKLEFYFADGGTNPSPLPSGYTSSFGEGETFGFVRTEGSVDDLDNTTGSYTEDGTGASFTRNANWFEFEIPYSEFSKSIVLNDELTGIAIDNQNNTSEFSPRISIAIREDCTNGSDDDGDGLVDCDDGDCPGANTVVRVVD